MNNWNRLERQLRGWKLRQPSRRLETQLFGRADRRKSNRTSILAWTAPAWVGVLAILITLSPGSGAIHRPGATRDAQDLVTSSLQHQALASYIPGTIHSERNRIPGIPAASFDWTNAGRILSSTGSFSQLNTNWLRR